MPTSKEARLGIAVVERTHEFKLTVPADAASLGIVRRAVLGLEEVCGPEVASRLSIIFSELVTNAICHSGAGERDPLEVVLQIGRDGVRGHVVDPGPGFDPDRIPARSPLQESGFGLRIVRALAGRWGVSHDGRTRVWFEL